ncbi:uncharacterized protein LOC129583723 [Paramacrobiotus metropolitanus]|uniref:uncharacterized protein LOC129583723 n=1 Tax=Paramacrobiotus metropolitanus TaxID=2943436 RepID=UPI0024464958|nr:uncharacterized protein LOC129583723 [Paramacrobiotus metropolitanus]
MSINASNSNVLIAVNYTATTNWTAANATFCSQDDPAWTGSVIFEAAATVLAIILNTAELIVFLHYDHLQTAFTLNIMALLASNIVLCVMNYPLDIIGNLYTCWWLSMPACNLYLYGNWVLAGGMMYMHVLITANRIWAMQFPLSYKRQHGSSHRSGFLLILLTWLFVHAICLPGVILDALYFRQSLSTGCGINGEAQVAWINTAQLLIYDMPVVFIAGAYPFLVYKQVQRQSRTNERRASCMMPSTMNLQAASGNGPISSHGHKNLKLLLSREATRAFLVLTVLSASVCICWTPSQVYWTIRLINPAIELPDTFYKIEAALYVLQSVMDPILFAVTFKDLRDVLLALFKGWCNAERRRNPSVWLSHTAQVHPS